MKLVIDNKSFVSAVNWVIKAFDPQQRNPQINLKVDDSGIGTLYLDSGVTFMRDTFTVYEADFGKGKDSFTAALDGQYMQKLAGVLAKFNDSITMKDSSKGVVIEAPHGNMTIPTEVKKAKSEPDVIELGEVEDREYFDSLQRLAKLCEPRGAGNMVTVLSSVNVKLDYENEKIVLMGTDKYSLGEISVNLDPNTSNIQEFIKENDTGADLLLPVDAATKINPSKGLVSTVTLITEEQDGRFGYQFDDGRVALFSLNSGKPLPYQTLKDNADKSTDNNVKLNVAEFKNALGVISALNWEEVDVFADVSEDGFVIRDSHSTNTIAIDAELDLDADKKKHTICFRRAIIGKATTPISTEKVNVRWTTDNKVFVFEPVLDDDVIDKNVFSLAIANENDSE